MPTQEYPIWVCDDCGRKHGHKEPRRATWHEDLCGVCGETKMVTEPRDFGHLKPTWKGVKE